MIPFNIVPQTFPGYEKKRKNLNFVIIQCAKKRKYFISLFIYRLFFCFPFVSITYKKLLYKSANSPDIPEWLGYPLPQPDPLNTSTTFRVSELPDYN